MTTFTSWDSELYHHGIKGQKWGIRRFQNPDGTLTAEGRARYVDASGHLTSKGRKAYAKEQRKLQKLSNRANLGKQAELVNRYGKAAKVFGGISAVSGLAAAGSKYGSKEVGKAAFNTAKESFKYGQMAKGVRGLNGSKYNLTKVGFESKARSNQLHDLAGKQLGASKTLSKAGKAAGAVAIAAAGASVASLAMRGVAKYRMSEVGHSKAVAKAQNQVARMEKMFGNVKLDDIKKKGK